MTNIRSVSITDAQNQFLIENPQLSLSNICQEGINQAIIFENSQATTKENDSLRKRIEMILVELKDRIEFIEKKGLMDEYLKGVTEK